MEAHIVLDFHEIHSLINATTARLYHENHQLTLSEHTMLTRLRDRLKAML